MSDIDPEIDAWSSTSALSWVKKKPRNNKQTWKLAEWLYDNCYGNGPYFKPPFPHQYPQAAGEWYDKAKQLTYMFAYNAFTGEDKHE